MSQPEVYPSAQDVVAHGPVLPRSAKVLPADEATSLAWRPAAAYLASHGVEFDATWAPRRFATGHANLNYLIRCNGGWAVLRRPPSGPLPPGAHDMAREHQVLGRLHQRFPLAPRSLAYCDDRNVIGAPFIVVEYRDGIVISGANPSHVALSREQCSRLSRRMIDVLVELHAVDAASVGLAGLGRPEGFLHRAVRGWGQRAAQVWQGARPSELDSVLGWLAERIPASPEACLLHCDFKLDNFIVDPDTLKPLALVDWDMSTRGDPLFDVATLLSYWTEATDPPVMHALDQMPTALPGFACRKEVLDVYAHATGRDVRHFRFYRVLCLLKLAVVFAQLHKRWNPADASTAKYARFEALSVELLRHCDAVRRGEAD